MQSVAVGKEDFLILRDRWQNLDTRAPCLLPLCTRADTVWCRKCLRKSHRSSPSTKKNGDLIVAESLTDPDYGAFTSRWEVLIISAKQKKKKKFYCDLLQ